MAEEAATAGELEGVVVAVVVAGVLLPLTISLPKRFDRM